MTNELENKVGIIPLYKRRWFLILVAVTSLVLVIFLINLAGSSFFEEVESIPVLEGSQLLKSETGNQGIFAADFTLLDLEGNEIQLSDFRGQVVILNFWTSWNPLALEQLKILNDYFEQSQKEAVILAINSQEDEEVVRNIQRRSNYSLTILLDKKGEVGELYQIGVLPITFFIDEESFQVRSFVGLLSVDDINTQLMIIR